MKEILNSRGEKIQIIGGGMGFNVPGWIIPNLAAIYGELGTVSGVCLEKALVRILQSGDPGGHIRRALVHFPYPKVAKEVIEKYFVEGGIPEGQPFKTAPNFTLNPSRLLIYLTICANFSFVWLAKEGHNGPVSINYLEKIAMPHLYAVYGAMLAKVDIITVGAGIALKFPAMINAYSEGQTAIYPIQVEGEHCKRPDMSFNPEEFFGEKIAPLEKPGLLPIISYLSLAHIFLRRLPEHERSLIIGFVVEESTAGGHNARPRRPPDYGPEDYVNYQELAKLGLPFFIGGSYASPEKLVWARSVGAQGIQVGSIFALCNESNLNEEIKRKARALGYQQQLRIKTDRRISPTGFPFKVACIPGTISEQEVYDTRLRICDQGVLVTPYEKPDGTIGYRCPAEPVDKYLNNKGGKLEDTIGRGCLCNGLLSAVGLNGPDEPAIITLGDDTSFLGRIMKTPDDSYSLKDAFNFLLGKAA